MMAAEEHGVARLNSRTQGVLPVPCRRLIRKLLGRSLLLVLSALLLVPEDALSLDCDYAIKLYDDAAKECKAGVRYEEVKYQPCEFAKLLEKNYRTCTGEPIEEPQSEFGVVMVLEELFWYDGLIVAASQDGYKQAELTALKRCMMRGAEERQCEEIDRFGEICLAVVEARFGIENMFLTADGDSRGHAEIEAIRVCEERVPETKDWANHCALTPSECSPTEIVCSIQASGCSPYEVVASMEEFKFRAAQTLDQISKMHEKENNELDESKIREEWSRAERSAKNPAWVRGIQLGLTKRGFSPGAIDGIWGLKTLHALRNWQKSKDEPTTAIPTLEQEQYLMDWDFFFD